jgi:phage terminase large subunit
MFDRVQQALLDWGVLSHPITLREAVEQAPVGGTDAVGTVFDAVRGVLGGIFGFLTILILTFYLLVDAQNIRQTFLRVFPDGIRFIPARAGDNKFHNPEYLEVLRNLPGWQRRAWLEGDWDIAAGQFFSNFSRDHHVIDSFDGSRGREWFAALDYGYTHYTVALLGCVDGDGNLYVVDEHAARQWLPQQHAEAIRAMLARHGVDLPPSTPAQPGKFSVARWGRPLHRFVAGTDVFSRQSDGSTVAEQYARLGINLRAANTDRVQGWAEMLRRLGNPVRGVMPTLFIHRRCARLAACLPRLQHDPTRPEDVLKVDVDEEGDGGDDAADACRYLVHSRPPQIHQVKLTGF